MKMNGAAVAMIIMLSAVFSGCVQRQPVSQTISDAVSEAVSEAIIGHEGKTYSISESSLLEIIDEATLYTTEYTYNSFFHVDDGKGKTKYWVSYNGNAKLGIDFNKIEITVDDENKHVIIWLPYVELESCTTDSIDYIFENDKYNTPEYLTEAKTKADIDLRNKVEYNKEIYDYAWTNTQSVISDLLGPWIELADYDYEIKSLRERGDVK